MTPLRIQRKRTRGWKMPGDTICVSRPSKWGNSFRIAHDMTREQAISLYELRLRDDPYRFNQLAELRGHHLACWCKLCLVHRDGKPLSEHCDDCAPCHVDVLGELGAQ